MNKIIVIFIVLLAYIHIANATNHKMYSEQIALDKLVKSNANAIIINKVEGITAILGFGHNSDVDGAEAIWSKGGSYTFPAAAGVTTIVSDSASDAAATIGALTVRVSGLDSNYAEISEDVTLTGTTVATLTNQFLRINLAAVLTAGTSGTNVGNLLMQVGGADVQYIEAGAGLSHSMLYTVPAEKTLYLLEQYATVQKIGAATGAVLQAKYRPFGGAWLVGRIIEFNTLGSTSFQDVLSVPFTIPAKSDFILEASAVSAGDVFVTGGFRGILKDD